MNFQIRYVTQFINSYFGILIVIIYYIQKIAVMFHQLWVEVNLLKLFKKHKNNILKIVNQFSIFQILMH